MDLDARAEVTCRDPASHQFHVAAASLSLGLAPLGVAGGEVALGILTVVSLARAKDLWPVWIEAIRTPLTGALAAFVVWMLVSLAWSPDPGNGIDQLQCMRTLMWAPLLYPLMRDSGSRITLLLALLAGITLLAVTQMWQFGQFHLGPGHSPRLMRFGGLHGEVGKAGLWSGAGVCIGAFLCVSPWLSRGARAAVAVAMLCCLGGLCACATLRAMAGTATGLVAVGLMSVAAPAAGDRRSRARVILPVAVALAGILLGAQRRWIDTTEGVAAGRQSGVAAQQSPAASHEADGAASTRAEGPSIAPVESPAQRAPAWYVALDSLPPRALWWSASWHAFTQHPVIGRGWGATPTIVSDYPGSADFVAQHPKALAQHPGMLTPTQPHSLYFMTLGEFGGVGAVLLALLVAMVVRNCVRAVRWCAELGGPAAATVLWLMAAGGDTVLNAAVFAAGAIFMAFTAPLPRLLNGSGTTDTDLFR